MRPPFANALPSAAFASFARAISQGDTTINFGQGISVPITSLVKGKPRMVNLLGTNLFRPVTVPTWDFSYMTFGLESQQHKDTRRSMRSVFEKSDRRLDTIAASLERHGWAALLDRDEIRIADAAAGQLGNNLNIAAMHAALARSIVELDLEYRRSVIALAAGSYSSSPDLDTTIAGGSEWNAAGDSRANIQASATALAAANGLQPDQVKVWLTNASMQAAMVDPEMTLRLTTAGSLGFPTAEQLRAYWGVGAVEVGDAYYTTDGSTLTSMYGDVAILTVNRPLAGFDEREGQLDSFVRFQWNNGVATTPFYDPDRTSWIYPWEAWEKAAQVNTTAAAILRNTAA